MNKQNIEIKKIYSKLKKEANLLKETNCLICKKRKSDCNSHIVPQSILKNISENGKVVYGAKLQVLNYDKIFEFEKGIKNAFTFHLICRECDTLCFKNYENNINELYEILHKNEQKILSEIALKNYLSHFNMWQDQYNFSKVTVKINNLSNQADLKELKEKVNFLSKRNTKFTIVYKNKLNYNCQIATQTCIRLKYDFKGKELYNSMDLYEVAKYIHLIIFPNQDNTTTIVLFTEKENIKFYNSWVKGFKSLKPSSKLHYISYLLFAYDEQFYLSPKFANILIKNEKALKLCDENFRDKNASDFKKYPNFFIRNFILKEDDKNEN